MKGTSKKRKIDILVLSDTHLGTYGCHAGELLQYLRSIKPRQVILNGDIIDIWQFNKRYWPKTHMKVIKILMKWISSGVSIYYVTGNHDEMLRKFAGLKIGSFRIVNKLLLDLDSGKKAWFFHGDVFDVTMQHSKWLAKLGAIGYDILIVINRSANFISEKIFKKGKISLSRKIKNSVKGAVKFISRFEITAAGIGIENGYDYVVCGHIHQPEVREMKNENGSIIYMNSGDWIENLTSLEYYNGNWHLYYYNSKDFKDHPENTHESELTNSQLYDKLIEEFCLLQEKKSSLN